MTDFPKQQRYVYEKSFDLGHVLQNLQGYKLATGDIQPSQLTHARAQFGSDEGKVYGSLITSAGTGPKSEPYTERRKRKRDYRNKARVKRLKRRHQSSNLSSPPVQPCAVDISKPTTSSLTADEEFPRSVDASRTPMDSKSSSGSAGSEDESDGDTEKVSLDQKSSSELSPKSSPPGIRAVGTSVGLLAIAHYADSSGSDTDAEGIDEWEDRENDKKGGKGDGYAGSTTSRGGKLEIPAVIQAMFESPSGSGDAGERSDDGEEQDPGLGFFQTLSDDSDTEESGTRQPLPGVEGRWDSERSKWIYSPSPLSTYTCWKCRKVGHLAEDCTVKDTEWQKKHGSSRPSADLQEYYSKCRELKRRRGDHCSTCGVHSNLACCLECGAVCCDGRGHLSSHLVSHPSHNLLYSYKLGRMLKCCKATCEVVNVYDLYTCSHCLGKTFSQHYSMINATWSRAGLRAIPNALCCEDHFHWHRMNCPNVAEEHCVTTTSLMTEQSKLISEFFF